MDHASIQVNEALMLLEEIEAEDTFIGDVCNPQFVRTLAATDGNVVVANTMDRGSLLFTGWMFITLSDCANTSGRTRVMLLPVSTVI